MGIEEYRHLRKTMLQVAGLTTEKKRLKKKTIENARQVKNFETERSLIQNSLRLAESNDSEPHRLISEKNVADLNKEKKKLEREVYWGGWRFDIPDTFAFWPRWMGVAVIWILVSYFIVILNVDLDNPDSLSNPLLVIMTLGWLIPGLLTQLHLMPKEVESREHKVEMINSEIDEKEKSWPTEITKLEKMIEQIETHEWESIKRFDSAENEMESIDEKINSLLKSVAHLIPYADLLDES